MQRRVEFVGSVIIFFVLLFVYSKWGPAIPFSTTTQSRGEPMVVSGDGKVSVSPDEAVISFGVEESGSDLKKTQENVNKKSKNLIGEIQKNGVDDKDIKTTSYNVYPENDYSNGVSRINGYRVSISYEIKLTDFDKINAILSVISQNGGNIVSGVNFDVSDKLRNEKQNEARKIAADNAKDKAQGLSKATGITLGRIINVSESQNGIYPTPMYAKAVDAMTTRDEIQAPEIKPGETEISVTINLSYEVR